MTRTITALALALSASLAHADGTPLLLDENPIRPALDQTLAETFIPKIAESADKLPK